MAASTQISFTTLLVALLFFPFLSGLHSATLSITNKCNYTVWPVILSTAGTLPPLSDSDTAFALQPSESNVIAVPPAWSGRVWARTLCSLDSAGKFSCATGDCGSSTVECAGGNVSSPVTLAEFTLNGAGGRDLFDVSLVEGYNIPMVVEPQGGTGDGNCTTTGCEVDLNARCPMALTVTDGGNSVACKSACQAFGDPMYCCSGAYASPVTCTPNPYSQFFKSVCPRAYSYVYDNISTTFSCVSADYTITFCPLPSTSLMGPAGNPFKVNNLGGQADESHNKGTAVGIALFILGVLIACTWTIKIRLSNENCEINVVAATRAGETIA